MADIIQEFTIKAPPDRVFAMFSTPEGLDRWWTKTSSGRAELGEEYTLGFGPRYDWKARVTQNSPQSKFELQIHDSDPDWDGTRVGCEINPDGTDGSRVRFYHLGWPENNEHWRVSCYCWAMYLRILRRNLEHGEFIPYEERLDV